MKEIKKDNHKLSMALNKNNYKTNKKEKLIKGKNKNSYTDIIHR